MWLLPKLARFGAVGAVAYVVDMGVFNVMIANGVGTLTAKVVSLLLSMLVAYFGNRWTFGADGDVFRFVVVNLTCGAVPVVCLFVSHHMLGMTGALADNISGGLVGTGVGTALRFVAYQRVVFAPPVVAVG